MRQVFMMLLAILFLLVGLILEGGNVFLLFYPLGLITIVGTTLVSTLFSFSFSEVKTAFREGFSTEIHQEKETTYTKSLLVIKSLQQLLFIWSFISFFVGLILILSRMGDTSMLGHGIAVCLISLIYGFGLRGILLVPIENSINKKLLQMGKA